MGEAPGLAVGAAAVEVEARGVAGAGVPAGAETVAAGGETGAVVSAVGCGAGKVCAVGCGRLQDARTSATKIRTTQVLFIAGIINKPHWRYQ